MHLIQNFQMKPAFIAVLALFCLSMAFAAPAPAPLLPVVVASGTTTSLALPSVVLASGTGVVPAAALLGAKKLLLAGALLAAQ